MSPGGNLGSIRKVLFVAPPNNDAKASSDNVGPTTADWLLFLFLVIIGGSSFAMIRGAVETVPPIVVTVGRLWIGAIFLYIVMIHAGRKFPPLLVSTDKGRAMHTEWRWMLAIAMIGYVGPFFIFPWAQQFIDSGLAGIYMAFMPIWTVVLAYFFAAESLGPKKIIGFLLGFAGVIILIGPDVFSQAGGTSLLAQAAVLAATIGYAAAAVITRNAPKIRPRVFAAGTLVCSSIIATPALFFAEFNIETWSTAGILNVIALGVGPTGLAGILLILLIQRVGAGFMALANYITPVWAVIVGAVLFQERLEISAFIALGIILTGVAISQHSKNGQQPTPNVGATVPPEKDGKFTQTKI